MWNLGDNFVTGDNVYLRELQNFFFEVLGMMSITHYGAIGDGRTDNYGPLQVAIDDAHRRGLSYIYVPYGRFIYTGRLINLDGITFVGNPHSIIVNIRTGEEIEILQFGVNGSMIDYYTKTQIDALLNNKQDKLIAGDGIKIVGNVISTTGGGGGGTEMRIITSDIVLSDGVAPALEEGWYYLRGAAIYLSGSPNQLIFDDKELVYYDAESKTLSGSLLTLTYSGGNYILGTNSDIEVGDTLSGSTTKIPSSHTVFQAIANISKPEFATSTYTGDGQTSKSIDLGYRPSKVEVIYTHNTLPASVDVAYGVALDGMTYGATFFKYSGDADVSANALGLGITSTGFTVGPALNHSDLVYRYIAYPARTE